MADNSVIDKDSPFHRFNRESGDQSNQLALLTKVLAESPELNRNATQAIRQNDLVTIGLLPADDSPALGHYERDARIVRFNGSNFDARSDTEDTSNKLTHVFGHELTHALRGKESRQYHAGFSGQVYDKAITQTVPRDYTGLVQEYMDWRRQEEALAEIGGINAVASRLEHKRERPVVEKDLAAAVARTSSCVEMDANRNAIGFKPGIHFDPQTQRISADVRNQEAVAQCFFDINRPKGAYVPGAAAEAISVIARAEGELGKEDLSRRISDAHINLEVLGVDPAQLAKEKLHLFPGAGPFHFTDTSNGRTVMRELQPAGDDGHEHKLIGNVESLLRQPETSSVAFDPRELGHPDHALYQQALAGVHRLDAEKGRAPDAISEQLAARLTLLAKEKGLERIDHVVLSTGKAENIFIVQGRMDDPAHDRAHTQTQAAADAPVADSFRQLEVLNKQQSDRQAVQQPLEQQQAPQQEMHRTPALSR